MCGIAGFVTTAPVTGGVAQLGRMTDAIRHRGPDDFGFYHDDWAHLGHRRLSIIDIAGGHQPMANETRTLWIAYNGEVYNHAELRPRLEQEGHQYTTRSDTETILHAFEQHGADCLDLFHGMFAFAIWDTQRRRLFCARDRLGIKPFYYYWDGRLFAFASEIKALLEHTAISPSLDEALLPEVLGFGYTSGDRTLFRNIRKLLPGHHLTLDITDEFPRLDIRRYWDVPAARVESGVSERAWIVETRRRLEQAVQMRLMSDVPLGVFLSGGVDSSSIAALVQQSTAEPIQTFAIGYDDPKFSELSYASRAARSIGAQHHEIAIGIDDFFSALPRLIWHEDEPIAWPSSVSLYFVSKLASEHVKVVLTGEGSDELFGGYERYRWHLLNHRAAAVYGIVPQPVRRWVRQAAASRLCNASLRRKLGHTIFGRENTIESLFLDNFYCAFPEEVRILSSTPSRAMYDSYLQHWNTRAEGSLLDRMLYADQKTYLVELLMKQDQMSMARSIESRVPFLDHTFVEFAMTIPDRLKIRGHTPKYILKKAVRDLLPRGIVYRKKMGFPTPLSQWLLDPRAEPLYAALRAPDGLLASYLDMSAVESLIHRHRSGLEDATDRIWRLINLQLWGDLFLTGRRDHWWNGAGAREAAHSGL
jgi:asparagine synthase (glutamine-hydrolysing)